MTTPVTGNRARRRRRVLEPPLTGRHDGAILTLLRQNEGLSRSAIAEHTGLSPTTVTKAVAPLITQGFVEETGSDEVPRIGRPAIGLRLIPSAATVCSIQIGVGTVRAALVDALGNVGDSVTFPFDTSRDASTVLAEAAERIDVELLGDTTPLAVGVATPGVVDETGRTNAMSINLAWRDVPVADIFEDVLDLPTSVRHNVSAMALAEHRFNSRGDNIAFLYVRTGVGLGLVLHGEPFVGGRHGVSEIGHVRVSDADGLLCSCGARGCIETVVAEPALSRQLGILGVKATDNPLLALERSAQNDVTLAHLRDQVIRHLATAITSIVNLFSPDLIVVGGMLGTGSDSFLTELTDQTRSQVFPLLRDEFKILRSGFGNEAGVIGAAAVALETYFYGAGAS